MKIRYIIATGLFFLGFLIHTIGRKLTDIRFLIASDIADNLKLEIRIVWHMVSLDFLASGVFLIIVIIKKSINQNRLLIDFIGLRMLLYGFLFLFIILFTNISLLLQVPQWILLFCIGLLLEWNRIKKPIKQ